MAWKGCNQIFINMEKRNSNIIKALKTRWFYFVVLLSFNLGVTTSPCELNAQSGCFTNGGPGCVGYLPILNQPNNNNYTIRVHFIALRRGDGSGGISEDLAQQSLDVLNNNFNQHNIFFDWDCELHELRNDSFYNHPLQNKCAIYSNILVPSGMNIFIGGDEVENAGIASGIPGASIIVSGTRYENGIKIIGSRGISIVHEMGHCLGLWHTHHGTEEITSGTNCGTPWSSGSCAECVDGSLSLICGDFVADTPADPNYWTDGCGYYGVGKDVCNQEAFNPNTDNVMNYALLNCRHFFTQGQATRMRNILEYHSFPTNILLGNRIINVTKSISGVPCQNSSISISYEFCLDGTNLPSHVDLNATITPSNQVTLSGDFPPTGIIQNLSITPACTTLVLVVNIGNIPVGDMFTVSLSILGNNGDGKFGIDDCDLEDVFSVSSPNAEFSFDTDNCTYLFESNDDLGTHTWNFGDNSPFSNLINPEHEFENGTYQVTHTVDYGCGIDVEVQTIVVDCFEDFECYCGPSGIHLGVENEPRFIPEYNIVGSIASKCVAIAGHLILNEDLTIVSSTVKMQPGSSIEILPGKTLKIFLTSISGCDEMWDGIVVNDTASIFLALTSIEDADIAITALNGAKLMVNSTQFNRNRIGITAQSSFNLNPFFGNTFDCSLPLSVPLGGQISEAGVVVAGGNLVTIGVQGQLPNTFKNMHNGIIAFNNSLTVVNTKFENLYADFGSGPISGNGIWANANTLVSSFKLTQKGNGAQSYSFKDCTTGIYANGLEVDVSNNFMKSILNGIVSIRGVRAINILNNLIYNSEQYGIMVSGPDPSATKNIAGNRFKLKKGTGIHVAEGNFPSPLATPGTLNLNSLSMQSSEEPIKGIDLYGASKLQVKENFVGMDSGNGSRIGINVSGGNGISVEGNSVIGPGSSSSCTGIAGWGAPNVFWSNNMVARLMNGFYFQMPCQTNNGFRCNEMANCQTGLHLAAGARLGTQSSTGNMWTGSFSDKGARHDGSGDDIFQSRFFADNSDTALWPTTFPISQWFVPSTTPTLDCGGLPPLEFGGNDDGDKKIAENTSTEFNTVRYLSERYLYRKLSEQPNIIVAGSSYESFYSLNSTTPIGKLFNMEQHFTNLMQVAPSIQQALDVNNAQLQEKQDALLETDSLLALATGPDSLTLLANRNNLVQQLDNIIQDNGLLWNTVQAQRTSSTSSMLVSNAAISTSHIFETNDKVVNEIYLLMVGNGIPSLTNSQITNLTNIANQCPETGGTAVFRARTLLAMATGKIELYHNPCNLGLLTSPGTAHVKEGTKSDMVIFPNPAGDVIHLTWTPSEQTGFVIVSDINGQIQLTRSLDLANGSEQIDISNLPPGLYICKVMQGENPVFSQKFAIIR